MKYLVALAVGFLAGAVLAALAVLYNPFLGEQKVSPLTVTDAATLTLNYSAIAADSILTTNNGELRRVPWPKDVLQLWERPIRQSEVVATMLRDGRNRVAGLGIKFSSLSESTRPLRGEAIVDSVWYVYVPGRGSLFIEQRENYWGLLRDVVVPAFRSSSDMWRGNWLGDMTAGPGALQTARVSGGSGEFANHTMIGLETLSVDAWSVAEGPVSSAGRLLIELPKNASAESAELASR